MNGIEIKDRHTNYGSQGLLSILPTIPYILA